MGEPEPPQIGHWLEREGDLGKDAAGMPRRGKRSVWVFNDAPNVQITQTVELVAGQESGQLDTCLVRYRIDNKDGMRHSVGLRFLLDTYIGANDGVPFLIPGQNQFCDDATGHGGAGHAVSTSRPASSRTWRGRARSPASSCGSAETSNRPSGSRSAPTRSTKLAKRMHDPRCDQAKNHVGRAGLRPVDR